MASGEHCRTQETTSKGTQLHVGSPDFGPDGAIRQVLKPTANLCRIHRDLMSSQDLTMKSSQDEVHAIVGHTQHFWQYHWLSHIAASSVLKLKGSAIGEDWESNSLLYSRVGAEGFEFHRRMVAIVNDLLPTWSKSDSVWAGVYSSRCAARYSLGDKLIAFSHTTQTSILLLPT